MKRGLVILFSLLLTGLAWAGDLDRAAELYAQRSEPGRAEDAVKLYDQAFKAKPGVEAGSGLTTALYWVAQHQSGKEARKKLHQEGLAVARTLIEAFPDNPAGYYWRGVHNVRLLKITEDTDLIKPVKSDMAKVEKMAPGYLQGGPARVLGRLYHQLPWIVGGSNSKAEKYLTQAVGQGPAFYLQHLYLAELYLDEGEPAKAKTLIDRVLSGKPAAGFEPEDKEWKTRAKKLAAKLAGSGPAHGD